jgi:RNA polymerase sigma-70 factor (ECF subfamily)
MAAAQRGDRGAYEGLLRQIIPLIRMRARRLCSNPADLEEVVQETLLSVHRVRHTYDPGRPFTPWLAAIIARRSIDGLRRRQRIARLETAVDVPEELDQTPLGASEEPVATAVRELDDAGAATQLATLLERLPPRQRQALEVLKVHEMSPAEASRATGQTTGALKVNAHRGLKRLRELLGRREEGP